MEKWTFSEEKGRQKGRKGKPKEGKGRRKFPSSPLSRPRCALALRVLRPSYLANPFHCVAPPIAPCTAFPNVKAARVFTSPRGRRYRERRDLSPVSRGAAFG
jgi:hypothetical protein